MLQATARLGLLAVATSLAGATGAASAQATLGVAAIPGIFEPSRGGGYDRILARLAASGLAINYSVLPPARWESDFRGKKFDCIGPTTRAYWPEVAGLTDSEPINHVKLYLFSRAGDGPFTSLDQVKGRKVGARRGLPYGPKFDASGIKADFVNEDDQNARKLAAGRIDAFVAFVPDMWIWAAEKKQPLPNHDKARPVETFRDGFTCRDTPAAHEFLKNFNAALVKLRASGELQKMLGDIFVAP